ncbi:hypothetical protein BCR39DRAFT_554082 [Naematelia encephala]|uniref:Uncharacterized protein n=1 Tax=Naematelia encephala TaxID=71784 RepID=A0A1Y2AG07_9TREE|nr:hypothetical protein BCR39DRAFT_554082 [Naematelia encephala]
MQNIHSDPPLGSRSSPTRPRDVASKRRSGVSDLSSGGTSSASGETPTTPTSFTTPSPFAQGPTVPSSSSTVDMLNPALSNEPYRAQSSLQAESQSPRCFRDCSVVDTRTRRWMGTRELYRYIEHLAQARDESSRSGYLWLVCEFFLKPHTKSERNWKIDGVDPLFEFKLNFDLRYLCLPDSLRLSDTKIGQAIKSIYPSHEESDNAGGSTPDRRISVADIALVAATIDPHDSSLKSQSSNSNVGSSTSSKVERNRQKKQRIQVNTELVDPSLTISSLVAELKTAAYFQQLSQAVAYLAQAYEISACRLGLTVNRNAFARLFVIKEGIIMLENNDRELWGTIHSLLDVKLKLATTTSSYLPNRLMVSEVLVEKSVQRLGDIIAGAVDCLKDVPLVGVNKDTLERSSDLILRRLAETGSEEGDEMWQFDKVIQLELSDADTITPERESAVERDLYTVVWGARPKKRLTFEEKLRPSDPQFADDLKAARSRKAPKANSNSANPASGGGRDDDGDGGSGGEDSDGGLDDDIEGSGKDYGRGKGASNHSTSGDHHGEGKGEGHQDCDGNDRAHSENGLIDMMTAPPSKSPAEGLSLHVEQTKITQASTGQETSDDDELSVRMSPSPNPTTSDSSNGDSDEDFSPLQNANQHDYAMFNVPYRAVEKVGIQILICSPASMDSVVAEHVKRCRRACPAVPSTAPQRKTLLADFGLREPRLDELHGPLFEDHISG